jgi:hypothetical protein
MRRKTCDASFQCKPSRKLLRLREERAWADRRAQAAVKFVEINDLVERRTNSEIMGGGVAERDEIRAQPIVADAL